MMVVNSFDLWQKDVFFSAAEEVQKSADIMESVYRLWIKEKKDEICKELKAALGTTKWQLDEFEKAIRLSHRRYGDDSTLTRHKQFVTAIENQIYRVETSLQEACNDENGKEPLRWVDLNEEERDDLAMFLSGSSSSTSKSFSGESSIKSIDSTNRVVEVKGYGNNGSECVIDIEERIKVENANVKIHQAEKTVGTRRIWSSPNFNALRIIVPGDNEDGGEVNEKFVAKIEATPKVKGTKQRLLDYNLIFDKTYCLQNPIRLPFNHPIKLTVSLMLMVFLLLPFVVYSS